MPAAPWEWMNPVISEKLTGRKSFRRQKWTGKLIFRVEVEQIRRPMFSEDRMDHYDSFHYIWRDASIKDAIDFTLWESENKVTKKGS